MNEIPIAGILVPKDGSSHSLIKADYVEGIGEIKEELYKLRLLTDKNFAKEEYSKKIKEVYDELMLDLVNGDDKLFNAYLIYTQGKVNSLFNAKGFKFNSYLLTEIENAEEEQLVKVALGDTFKDKFKEFKDTPFLKPFVLDISTIPEGWDIEQWLKAYHQTGVAFIDSSGTEKAKEFRKKQERDLIYGKL